MLVATFDIGTTAVKAVAVRDDGEPFFTGSQVIHTIEKNGFKEQNPEEWYSAFCALSHALTDKISAKDISALIFSGQMQDVILLPLLQETILTVPCLWQRSCG